MKFLFLWELEIKNLDKIFHVIREISKSAYEMLCKSIDWFLYEGNTGI